MSNDFSPPSYCNQVEQLIPFANKQAAEMWLQENQLDITSTPLLLPFLNKNKQVEFLKRADKNDCIRIMGAANYVMYNNNPLGESFDWLKKQFRRDFAPHLNALEGESIQLAEHCFLIIYEKGSKSVGKEFAELFRKEKEVLQAQIKNAQHNEVPFDPASFMERLSLLALDLEIKIGMSYFIITSPAGEQTVYRQIFKKDAANDKLESYFVKEKQRCTAKPVQVQNNKIENHHRLSFINDWFKWSLFALVTAVGVGGVASLFMPSLIAGSIAALAFLGGSFFGFYRAINDNANTIEFGKTEFQIIKPQQGRFAQLQLDLRVAMQHFFKKTTPCISEISPGNNAPAIQSSAKPALTDPQFSTQVQAEKKLNHWFNFFTRNKHTQAPGLGTLRLSP
jgi:hypothetical protein